MSSPAFKHLPQERLIEVTLDPRSIARSANPNVERERQIAIYDLLDDNFFELVGQSAGPYRLTLGSLNARLLFHVQDETGQTLTAHNLPFAPLRRIVRDYFIMCEAYQEAIKSAPPPRIQEIDRSRCKLHDEAGRTLVQRLADKITVDHNTGRRLFTLICSLHWKG